LIARLTVANDLEITKAVVTSGRNTNLDDLPKQTAPATGEQRPAAVRSPLYIEPDNVEITVQTNNSTYTTPFTIGQVCVFATRPAVKPGEQPTEVLFLIEQPEEPIPVEAFTGIASVSSFKYVIGYGNAKEVVVKGFPDGLVAGDEYDKHLNNQTPNMPDVLHVTQAEKSKIGDVDGKQPKITSTGTANLLTAPSTAGGNPGTKPVNDFTLKTDFTNHADNKTPNVIHVTQEEKERIVDLTKPFLAKGLCNTAGRGVLKHVKLMNTSSLDYEIKDGAEVEVLFLNDDNNHMNYVLPGLDYDKVRLVVYSNTGANAVNDENMINGYSTGAVIKWIDYLDGSGMLSGYLPRNYLKKGMRYIFKRRGAYQPGDYNSNNDNCYWELTVSGGEIL